MKIIQFCFAHKTASMFAHQVLTKIARGHDLAYFSPNNTPPNHTALRGALDKTSDEIVLFGPARTYVPSPVIVSAAQDGHSIYSVCQVRNPLDIVVSQYFSHGWIHPDEKWNDEGRDVRRRIQTGDISIVEYAHLEIAGKTHFSGVSIVDKLRGLDEESLLTKRIILTYEEFYTSYDSWTQKLAAFLPAELDVEDLLLSLRPTYDRAVVLSEDEFFDDPLEYVRKFSITQGRHVRSAAPGDHKHFIRAEEIEHLREKMLAANVKLDQFF